MFRKTLRGEGRAAKLYIEEMKEFIDHDLLKGLGQATDKILELAGQKDMDRIAFLSSPYLKAFGFILGGALIEQAARANETLKDTAGFYKENILPLGTAHISMVTGTAS